MKSNQILIVLVVALMLVNCALLAFLWRNNYSRGPHNDPGPAYEFLTKQLRLTPQQQQEYTVMRGQHFNFTEKINDENRLLRDSFFSQVKMPVPDEIETARLEHQITANQQKIDSATLYHFRHFRAILDEQQQQKFDHLLNDVLHMISGHGRPGPGGEHPGPEGNGPPPDAQRPPNGPPANQ